MKKTLKALVLLFQLSYFFCCHSVLDVKSQAEDFIAQGEYLGEYWPTDGWRTCRPEEVGMDSGRLKKVFEYAANPNITTQGIAIIKNGYVVGEAYLNNFTMQSRHESYSMAKSFASALIGIAIDKGFINGVDERVSKFYPEWQKPGIPETKKEMILRHLLTMTSGLQWNEKDYYRDRSQNDVFKMIEARGDYIQYVLNRPVAHEPGDHWNYSSGDSMLLSGIIEKSTNMSAFKFGMRYLFQPMGLTDIIWLRDPAGHTITAWGIQGTVREFAKFGYLYLKEGLWESRYLISSHWVKESLRPVSEDIKQYGYQWWRLPVLRGYADSKIPAKTFLAWGIYTQQIFVIPEEDLVIVRLGNDSNPYQDEWVELEFLELVLAAIKN